MKSDLRMIHVEQNTNIPSLADLALEYGTISQDQHKQLLTLFVLKDEQADIGDLLSGQGMVTPQQLELLKLIQEYHIVRKSGEEFGKIAVEKGLASMADISQALKLQKLEFKESRQKKMIGDILVESRIITSIQKDEILKSQGLFGGYSSKLPRTEDDSLSKTEQAGGDAVEQSEISIVVSTDHMTAWIKRANPNEIEVTVNRVKKKVAQYGIVKGVFCDFLIQCFLDTRVKKFPIARVDGFNLLKRETGLAYHIYDDNNKLVAKKKGELLTEQANAETKVQIENLYGENTEIAPGNDFTVRCGENTRRSKDGLKILAVKSGIPAISAARSVFIHPVVNILEDADQRYGPVESYADLSVSGTVTGAYPITAGKLNAEEIRGAVIESIGDIKTEVGITGAIIRTQGDVRARYIHNSRIEAFGNIYVQNEIIDSQIRCSGKLDSPNCRTITSRIYAKGGVVLSGVGSVRSTPSTIVAGGAHHAVGIVQAVLDKIDLIQSELEDLKDEKNNQQLQAEKIFKKMIALKALHDKAKKKKDLLLAELNKTRKNMDEKTFNNVKKLIIIYEKRVNGSLVTLKKMNVSKKEHEDNVQRLKGKIRKFSVWAEKKILSHEKTLFAYLENTRKQNSIPKIEIKGKAYFGTNLGGVYKMLSLAEDKTRFKLEELYDPKKSPMLKFNR